MLFRSVASAENIEDTAGVIATDGQNVGARPNYGHAFSDAQFTVGERDFICDVGGKANDGVGHGFCLEKNLSQGARPGIVGGRHH